VNSDSAEKKQETKNDSVLKKRGNARDRQEGRGKGNQPFLNMLDGGGMERTHLAAVLGLEVCKNPFPRVFQLGMN